MKISNSMTFPSGVSLHFTKYKANDVGVNGLQRHNERVPGQKHSNENIDDSRTDRNIILVSNNQKLNKRVADKIDKKRANGLKGVRKDAVRMVEGTVQLSGQILERSEAEQIEVLKDSFEWFEETFGKDNIVSAVIHLDESTPHLHVDFVPFTKENKLSAKQVLSKEKLRGYQKSSLEFLQNHHVSLNFQRGSNEFNGLKQKDFEKVQLLIKDAEDKQDERENRLDNREEALELKKERINVFAEELVQKTKDIENEKLLLDQREKNLLRSEEKQKSNVKSFRESVDALNHEMEVLNRREVSLEARERRLETRELEVNEKDRLSDKKLLEAKVIRNKADELFEQVNAIKKSLADRWQMILDMVRAGELKAKKVEDLAEKYDPFSEDDIGNFSEDVLQLSRKQKSRQMGL